MKIIKRSGVEVIFDLSKIPVGTQFRIGDVLLELTQSVNACLRSMTKRERDLFVARYWYSLPVKELAERFELTESNVKQILHRTREKLQRHLREEGLC